MNYRIIIPIAVMAMFMASSGPLPAEDLSSEDIINSLAPKKVKTRGIGSQGGLSTEDQRFIGTLKNRTRAIVVEERERLVEVIEINDLPSLDLEIYFAYDSSTIAPEAVGGLVQLGRALSDSRLSEADLLVSGHTDAIGSDEYNQKLSEERAQSVKRFLAENFEVSTGRLIAVGYGEERLKNPAMPEADENRRVTIVNLSP